MNLNPTVTIIAMSFTKMYEQTVIDGWQIEDERIHKCSSQFQLIFNYANSHRLALLWRPNFWRLENVFCWLWCSTICAAPAEQKWKYMFLRRIPHGEKRNEFLLVFTFLLCIAYRSHHRNAPPARAQTTQEYIHSFLFFLNSSSILLHAMLGYVPARLYAKMWCRAKSDAIIIPNEIWIFKLVSCLFVFVSNLLFGLVFLSFRWCFVKWIMIWI